MAFPLASDWLDKRKQKNKSKSRKQCRVAGKTGRRDTHPNFLNFRGDHIHTFSHTRGQFRSKYAAVVYSLPAKLHRDRSIVSPRIVDRIWTLWTFHDAKPLKRSAENLACDSKDIVYFSIPNFILIGALWLTEFWIFGALIPTHFIDHGEIWHARANRWCAPSYQISSWWVNRVVPNWRRPQIWPNFQIQHSLRAPSSGAATNLNGVYNQKPFHYPTTSKLFLNSNNLMAIGDTKCSSFDVLKVTDKKRQKIELLRRLR